MPKKLTLAEFTAAAQKVHGDRYDYSQAVYTNATTRILIVCPDHGPFSQTPRDHVHSAAGCPACSGNERLTPERFLQRARAAHGDTYDYSKVDVSTQMAAVTIICPTHGEFTQLPKQHLKGRGCPKCGGTHRLTREEILAQFAIAHGDRYDYSAVTYKNMLTEVDIICREHGVFRQLPGVHKLGHGCPQCGVHARSAVARRNPAEVAAELHEAKPGFSYDTSEYTNNKGFISVTCDRGHQYKQRVNDARRYGCPVCAGHYSKGEQEVREFVASLGVHQEKTRKIIPPKELDVWCPEQRVGFEYNGLYYHSEANGVGRTAHYDKSNAVAAAGGRLVHIWSDDWTYRRSAVEGLIKAALGLLPAVNARACSIRTVEASQAKAFLEQHHLQGYTGAHYIGLWLEEALVACMGVAPARSIRGEPEAGVFELVRYAASHRVRGGGSRLLQAWKHHMTCTGTTWTTLITYCDLAHFTGGLYTGMGFEEVSRSGPDYKVIKAGSDRRLHKSNVQKAKLKVLLGDRYDETKTEAQLCEENYIFRVWDCGKVKFALRNHTV